MVPRTPRATYAAPHELPALVAAHARVEVALADHIKVRLLCLAACAGTKAALSATHACMLLFEATAHPDADTREAAQTFGVVLAAPSDPDPMSAEDIALTTELAHTGLKNATGAASKVQLTLGHILVV
eukprot:gnl/Chilomastix_cuspidata/7977.p2 GENE.gnl/Chilomastix_cuspidata/7977~~gnl/Chilomastix_cuspidata/7977.p2  ORF type:complete len:149 (+),score=25.40 gnl/Chilomastix_cuspidata/7977:64-447(+)